MANLRNAVQDSNNIRRHVVDNTAGCWHQVFLCAGRRWRPLANVGTARERLHVQVACKHRHRLLFALLPTSSSWSSKGACVLRAPYSPLENPVTQAGQARFPCRHSLVVYLLNQSSTTSLPAPGRMPHIEIKQKSEQTWPISPAAR